MGAGTLMYSMDDMNALEVRIFDDKDLIAVYFRHPESRFWKVKRFNYREMDAALDYFNQKKREGMETRMKKVTGVE